MFHTVWRDVLRRDVQVEPAPVPDLVTRARAGREPDAPRHQEAHGRAGRARGDATDLGGDAG